MVRLSLWQWHRGRAHGSLLNYAYAVEWLVFAVFTLVVVGWLLLEQRRGTPLEQPPSQAPRSGLLIGPPLAAGEPEEEVTYVRLLRRLRVM